LNETTMKDYSQSIAEYSRNIQKETVNKKFLI
jgi:hypothetical protein